VGARIPQDVDAPLRAMVWPLWTGRAALPTWWTGQRFTASVAAVLARDWEQRLRASRPAIQFLPLVVAQLLAIVAIYFYTARPSAVENANDAGEVACHKPEAQAKGIEQ